MTLEELNTLDRQAAEQVFLGCCGSTGWARAITAQRPFRDAATMAEAADRIWLTLDTADWREAFAAHPRIGETDRAGRAGGVGRAGGSAANWSSDEQAGMGAATDVIRERLAAVNREYETRFGFIYVVCATGRTAGEMLEIAERRLSHSLDEELTIAAEEQRKITRLRLEKLIS